ncbi:MAG: prolipoprotein diacylglyceryl transferase [Candidatus Cloacimonetes bacterium]|nr:prolipoprotein diacylglyceryl transferase [Candidatus Cloacimonadota bacterium]
MFSFLHAFHPQPIIFSLGPINIYWYGLFIVLGMTAALGVAFYLGKKWGVDKDLIFDLAFWLIIAGVIGARIYDVFLELPYYISHPAQIIKIWEGGLSIHGGIIAGLIVIAWFARRYQINFWKLSAIIAPGLALGQAIGRWGNYFNQELFGTPTAAAWGIPIDLINRPINYISSEYFHPTFLYESLGCLIIFISLLIIIKKAKPRPEKETAPYILVAALYMILYSILRFSLEFIKINPTPIWLGLRWPQIISLLFIVFPLIILLTKKHASEKK